jgi:O-antigen ligase
MTAMTMTMPHARGTAGIERLTVGLLLGFVASLQISIAAANILLAATLALWAVTLVRDRTRPIAPPFFLPLVVYGVATLLSATFSIDRATSLIDCKQLVLFAIVPLVYDAARGERTSTVVDVIVSVGAASAAYGIIQYGMLHYDNLGRRPEGALTHYMTYSGILMLVICAAAARLIFGARDRLWPALVMPAVVVALSLTFTRSAFVGACVAVGLLFVLKDFRLTALLPVVIALLFALAPGQVANRMMSMFNAVPDATNQDRLAMMEVGARMVKDHPFVGVGPNMVPRLYAQYRPDYAVNPTNPHLHNVPLQIAAERGLVALAAWLWFLVALAMALFRLFRQQTDRTLAAAALASIAAMLAAGFFEYNFGDSEFLMMFLVVITLPFAAANREEGRAPSAARA